jgi:hypothetical protein
MPLSVSMLTVSHGEILYFQPPANQKRKLLYDLASFRYLPPAPSTLSSIARKPRPTTTTRTPASPSGAASNAVVAAGCPAQADAVSVPRPPAPVVPTPTLSGIRIRLKFSHLHKGARIIELSGHPGDASFEKVPQDASPNRAPPP